jgi:hypothetical protein
VGAPFSYFHNKSHVPAAHSVGGHDSDKFKRQLLDLDAHTASFGPFSKVFITHTPWERRILGLCLQSHRAQYVQDLNSRRFENYDGQQKMKFFHLFEEGEIVEKYLPSFFQQIQFSHGLNLAQINHVNDCKFKFKLKN